jgi:leukotriene-A4 hydrolase
MENPCLTFVTPTLLAGDKSLVGTIIHEICHSWTGNLVTNRNWQNFWLNEGFTKFCEKKLIGILFGHDNFLVESYTGYKSLCKTIESIGSNHSFTSLYPQLQDVLIS